MRLGESYWIGLRERNNEGEWLWTDYSPLSYTNWNPGEPNNYGGDEACVAISYYVSDTDGSERATWNDAHCSGEMNYICQKWVPPPMEYNGIEYRVSMDYETQTAASAFCKEWGGELASI